MKRAVGLVSTIAVLVFGACASELDHVVDRPRDATPQPGSSQTDTQNFEGPWRLVEGDGPKGAVRPTPGWDISASITDSLMSGNSSCNNYYIGIEVDGSSLSFTGKGSIEEMGCGGPTDVQDEYISALMASTEITRDGDRLIISGPESRLVFEEGVPAPMDEMVDREWRLVRFIHDQRTGAVAPATLRFTRVELNPKNATQGKYTATTGCGGRHSGTWTVEGERVVFLSGGYRGRNCSDDALQDQHDAVGLGMSDWLTAKVAGNKLTIFADRSRVRLVYRATK